MKIAIVGCGGIAAAVAQAINANRRVEACACCDVTLAGAERFAGVHGIPRAYENYEIMLAQEDLDAVYLAVPHYLHHPMILTALRTGRHIWCEKPITMNQEEALDVIEKAREVGAKVGINYQTRYDPSCVKMRDLTQSGALGEIFYARTNTIYHRTAAYYAGWHGILAQSGGGTLLTVGSHMIDAVLWAVGSKPVTAWAVTAQKRFKDIEVEDLAMGIVELENGTLLNVTSSMVATPERRPVIELYGAFDTYHYPSPTSDEESDEAGGKFENNITRSLEGFRAWIEDDNPYRIPAEEAVPALAVVEAMYRSAKSGKREDVKILI